MNVPDIVLVPLPGRRWRIEHEFRIETAAAGLIVIPAGFICDLNSIPRFLWWASTPTDYPHAGATHDFLYDQQSGRSIADAVYYELLVALGMSLGRARMRYYALRFGGGFAYRAHANHDPGQRD